MDAPVRIAVGSTNPIKIAAVQAVTSRALPQAEVIGLDIASGISEQPWGDEQTRKGALNRARSALAAAGTDFGVGLEGGVLETEMGLMTCAWCVIVDRDGHIGVGGGVHMLLPPLVAQALQNGGELGPAMDRLTGQHNTKQAQGAVGILTGGLSDRQAAYAQLVTMALGPFLKAEYYRFEVSSQNVGADPCGRPVGRREALPLPRIIEKIRFEGHQESTGKE
jgi:inosine/xanthosine triphosphatase